MQINEITHCRPHSRFTVELDFKHELYSSKIYDVKQFHILPLIIKVTR